MYRRSNYGDLRVSTFVKLASARMVCFVMYDVRQIQAMVRIYVSYEPWRLRCIPHNIQPPVLGHQKFTTNKPLAECTS